MTDAAKTQALCNWLIGGAQPQVSYPDIVAELGRRLVAAGVEAELVSIYQTPKNPLLGGHRLSWTPSHGAGRRNHTHADLQSPYFIGGCINRAGDTGRMIRYRIGDMPEFDTHPGSQRLISDGYSEYAILPMTVFGDFKALLGVGTRRPGGFPDDQIDACRRITAPLARVVELEVRREEKQSLLTTYLGRDAGQRVATGMVRRGDAEMVRAIILFTDIADFTALSNRLPIHETVETLNRYFEALEQPILAHGGEVLKLIGDGLMAIFPTPDDLTIEEGAAFSALTAVEEARGRLSDADIHFRAAFHIGDIHYGNIGGLTRLDFTAIGPAVNLAARLLDAASGEGVEATCSAAFARLVPERARPLGEFDFKGFDAPEEVFDTS